MNPRAASLDQIQRWMQAVLMHPGDVAEALESGDTRRHLDVAPADLESVIRRSRALASAERLEIYVDAYYERLLECLVEEFPATRQACGADLFHGLAFGYLQSYPSRSYTLGMLGEKLAEYLAESRIHERQPPPDALAGWGEFVVELAEFERLLREIFDGPGVEGQPAMDASLLTGLQPDEWETLTLTPAPCLRLRRYGYPVHEFWSATKKDLSPLPGAARDVCLAITRKDYAVEISQLSCGQFELLERLVEGQSLATALSALVRLPQVDAGKLQSALPAWFFRWASDQWFIALRTSGSS